MRAPPPAPPASPDGFGSGLAQWRAGSAKAKWRFNLGAGRLAWWRAGAHANEQRNAAARLLDLFALLGRPAGLLAFGPVRVRSTGFLFHRSPRFSQCGPGQAKRRALGSAQGRVALARARLIGCPSRACPLESTSELPGGRKHARQSLADIFICPTRQVAGWSRRPTGPSAVGRRIKSLCCCQRTSGRPNCSPAPS